MLMFTSVLPLPMLVSPRRPPSVRRSRSLFERLASAVLRLSKLVPPPVPCWLGRLAARWLPPLIDGRDWPALVPGDALDFPPEGRVAVWPRPPPRAEAWP